MPATRRKSEHLGGKEFLHIDSKTVGHGFESSCPCQTEKAHIVRLFCLMGGVGEQRPVCGMPFRRGSECCPCNRFGEAQRSLGSESSCPCHVVWSKSIRTMKRTVWQAKRRENGRFREISPVFSFLSHSFLIICPISPFIFPYITCLRYFGANTM